MVQIYIFLIMSHFHTHIPIHCRHVLTRGFHTPHTHPASSFHSKQSSLRRAIPYPFANTDPLTSPREASANSTTSKL